VAFCVGHDAALVGTMIETEGVTDLMEDEVLHEPEILRPVAFSILPEQVGGEDAALAADAPEPGDAPVLHGALRRRDRLLGERRTDERGQSSCAEPATRRSPPRPPSSRSRSITRSRTRWMSASRSAAARPWVAMGSPSTTLIVPGRTRKPSRGRTRTPPSIAI